MLNNIFNHYLLLLLLLLSFHPLFYVSFMFINQPVTVQWSYTVH